MSTRKLAFVSIAAVAAALAASPVSSRLAAQRPAAAASVDWALHNFDLAGTRFSTLDQIKTSNVKALSPAGARDRSRFDALFTSAGGDPEDRGAPVLFHVSSFRPVKRVVDLVEVLAAVRRHTKARLMLVGDGPDRQKLMQRARELDVHRSVCLVGSHADFVDYLRHADLFLLPSESESFGVAALEALSCGVPVIAYRVGGLPDVVVPHVGRLVAPFDLAAFAATVVEILSDPGLRTALGVAARAHAESRFRRDGAIERYEDHYRRVLAASHRETV